MSENGLREKHSALVERVHSKRKELEAARFGLDGLVSELLDAEPKRRAELVEKRGRLAFERDALGDELAALVQMRDASYLAIFTQALVDAEEEFRRVGALHRENRLDVGSALDARRRVAGKVGLNGVAEQVLIDEAQRVAGLKLHGEYLTMELSSAKLRLEHARRELDAAKMELGISLN